MLEGSVYFPGDFQTLLIHVNRLFLVKCHLTAAQDLTHVSTLMLLASGYPDTDASLFLVSLSSDAMAPI